MFSMSGKPSGSICREVLYYEKIVTQVENVA